jgi:transposase InsO family protein
MSKIIKLSKKEFRYSIIAPVISGSRTEKSEQEFFRNASKLDYWVDGIKYNFSESTLKGWVQRYRKGGPSSLENTKRSDKGTFIKIDESMGDLILGIIQKYPKYSNKLIYNELVKSYSGTINFSSKTLQRYIQVKQLRSFQQKSKQFLSFNVDKPNQLWQTDTKFVKVLEGASKSLKIIGFIDDFSRRIVAIDIYMSDNGENVIATLKKGVSACGKVKSIYCDNGSSFVYCQLLRICTRAGITHLRAKPYSPESKGKIERFWLTLDKQWTVLHENNKFKSLSEARASLFEYIDTYNNTIHSSLDETPNQLYFKNVSEIDKYTLDELNTYFLYSETRTIRKDGLIKIKNIEFEINPAFAGRTMEFLYDSKDLSKVYVDEGKKGLVAYKVVNKVANSQIKRNFMIPKEDNNEKK